MNILRLPIHCLSIFLSNLTLGNSFASHKNSLLKGLSCFLVVLGVISLISSQVSVVYSKSNSLPYHFFLNLKHLAPKKGHYTCFHSHWYGGQVIKKVVGMEGDTLTYDNEGNLWLVPFDIDTSKGTRLKIGKQQEFAKDGRKLTPITAGFIPKGKVFVLGEHERSFDSRYAELGLVSLSKLNGRLIALM